MENFELIDNLFQIAVLLCALCRCRYSGHSAQEPQPPDVVPRLCLLCHGDHILCAVSGHHWHLAAGILCG